MNNGLHALPNDNLMVVLSDKIIKAEYSSEDQAILDSGCINIKGKYIRLVQYLQVGDLKCVVIGQENEIILSDLKDCHELFHLQLDSENATCGILKFGPILCIGTSCGRTERYHLTWMRMPLKSVAKTLDTFLKLVQSLLLGNFSHKKTLECNLFLVKCFLLAC